MLGGEISTGLGEALADAGLWRRAVYETASPRLNVMPNNGLPPGREPNFSAEQWNRLLEALKSRYSLVLIDGPSLVHPAAAETAAQCDGVYLLIRLGYTTPGALRQAVRVVRQAGGRLLGSIVVGD